MATSGEDGKSSVYIRIRPLENDPSNSCDTGPSLHKIESWTDDTVVAADIRGLSQTFNYPRAVVPPEATQEQAYNNMNLPEMLDKFLFEQRHCTLVAYGQTGSGKTHTMFGPGLKKGVGSSGNGLDPSWGLFPRAIVTALQKMKALEAELGSGVKCVFSASVVELYMFECADLLNSKAKIHMSAFSGEFDWSGLKEMVIADTSDIQKLVDVVFTERQSRTTAMNERSSRSHCVASLNLTRVDVNTRKVFRSTFMFCDLSGSERTSKTGFTKGTMAGDEGIMINYDLSALHFAVEMSSKVPRSKLKKLQKFDGILPKVMRSSLTGDSITACVVCLSPHERNGGESFYSLKWGADMSRLRVISDQSTEGKDLDKEKKRIEKDLKEENAAIQNLVKNNPANPNLVKRQCKAAQLSVQLDFLSKLLD